MRMPTLVLATLSSLLTGPLDSVWAQDSSGDELFQQALVLERSSGELDGAAEVYRRIVREFPADRPLVAKALVRLGLTLEVLGQPGAEAVYERVVREFFDQSEPAAEARARLVQLAAEKSTGREGGETGSRMVMGNVGCTVYWMRASRDGERVAYRDMCGATAGLLVRDLTTGELRRIGLEGGFSGPVWSPDGSRLAVLKLGEGLRILDAVNGEDDTPDGVRETEVYPMDWSADGKHLGAVSAEPESPGSVVVSLENGQVVRLTGSHHHEANAVRFSPDGRRVVFMDYVDGALELFLSAVDGTERQRLTDSGGRVVRSPLWSPDGALLIYQESDSWRAIPMDRGAPSGPSRALSFEPSHLPVDWTESGLLHAESSIIEEPLEIPLEPERAVAAGPEQRLSAMVERGASWMVWSPDMSRLALTDWDLRTVRIYSEATGSLTEYPMGTEFLPSHVWWSGDGSELLFTTAARGRRDPRSTIFALDPGEGSVRELFGRLENAHHLHLSPDREWMTFVTNLTDRSVRQELVVSRIGASEGVILASAQGPASGFSARYGQPLFSPDGSHVLYLTVERSSGSAGGGGSTYWVVASDGSSTPLPLLSREGGYFPRAVWSPDGRFVAVLEVDGRSGDRSLSVVSVETGERHELASGQDLELKYWAPDGRSLGITRSTGSLDLWLSEGDRWSIPPSGPSAKQSDPAARPAGPESSRLESRPTPEAGRSPRRREDASG